jgi:hypothetical protein
MWPRVSVAPVQRKAGATLDRQELGDEDARGRSIDRRDAGTTGPELP